MVRLKTSAGFFLGALVGICQTVAWRGPISGIVHDAPSHSLRQVVGVPGGAYLGAPLRANVESAAISPDGNAAVATEDGRAILIEELRNDSPLVRELADVGEISAAAWGVNSGVAVIYSASSRRVWRITIGTEAPDALVAEPGLPEGEVASVATDADGTRVLVSLRHPENGGIYEMVDGSAVRVVQTPAPGAIVFSSVRSEFLALDNGERRVLKLSSSEPGAWEQIDLASDEDQAGELKGLAVSKDGRNLYVAADGRVLIYDLGGRFLSSQIDLPAAPDRVAELAAADAVYVLTSRQKSEEPLWILDARRVPSVFFVPAGE
ncbi:MAG: hypothetical protein R2729_23420 [Bryobacteraceae bacterium]